MKVTALMNFKANGVDGYPGKVLSDEEKAEIESLLDELVAGGLVSISDDEPANEPEIVIPEEEEKPKSKKKKH